MPKVEVVPYRYGIVLDAGSSGTRLHIYRWLENASARAKGSPQDLQSLPAIETKNKWTEKIKPGISTFGDKPSRVGPDHLKELLHKATKVVPKQNAPDTPLFLLATAGMRLLEEGPRQRLLQEICSYARSQTDFSLPDCDLHIRVIPGDVEGLYGWIAANYLLGGFEAPLQHAGGNDHNTYGFLDMGGASAQIAFAPNMTESERHANDLRLLRLRTVDGTATEYKVFTTTWLGFGVNEARKHYVETLQEESGSLSSQMLQDPCLPSGLSTDTKGDVLLPGNKEVNGKTPSLEGTGEFDKCLKKTFPLLEKDHVCEDSPCLIGGTHVPAIDFDVNHFVGVSEYWHTTHEIFQYDNKDKAYDFNTYQQRVSDFCSQDWSKIEKGVKAHDWGKKVNEKTAIEVCFKASWLINILHEGIGIPRVGVEDLPDSAYNGTKKLLDGTKSKGFKPSFQAINKIDDTEVSWTLGKMVLYASSLVPPSGSTLPVGFGSNVPDIPQDFQYPSATISTELSTNNTINDPWTTKIISTATPRRIPGIIIFLLIFVLAAYMLCGRSRRQRFINRFNVPSNSRRSPIIRSTGKKSSWTGKSFPSIFHRGTGLGDYERVLEDGSSGNDDFELGSVEESEDHNEASDSSSSSHASKTSGWATPRSRGGGHPSSDGLNALGKGHGLGLGLGGNAMNRSGLIGRTESREKIVGMGEGRSRRASPSRGMGLMLGSVVED